MTGLDTNVLVRYIVRDHPAQTRRADETMQALTPQERVFISLVALAELAWVLRSYYRMPKAELIRCITRLLSAQNVEIEGSAAVQMAVAEFANARCDFADCLIERCGYLAGCGETVTFDRDAARFAGMRLL